MAEVVSQYIDQLHAGNDDVADYLSVFATFRSNLEPLLLLSRRVKSALALEKPSPRFKESLKTDLVAAWHRQKRDEAAEASAQRRNLLIRAAAVGSFVSVAALVAVVARSRSQGGRLL